MIKVGVETWPSCYWRHLCFLSIVRNVIEDRMSFFREKRRERKRGRQRLLRCLFRSLRTLWRIIGFVAHYLLEFCGSLN